MLWDALGCSEILLLARGRQCIDREKKYLYESSRKSRWREEKKNQETKERNKRRTPPVHHETSENVLAFDKKKREKETETEEETEEEEEGPEKLKNGFNGPRPS